MKNPEITQKESIQKTEQSPMLLISGILFIFICSLSAFFLFQNNALEQSIENSKNEMNEYTKSIEKLQKDRKIIAGELVRINKKSIENSIALSEVQKYIAELERVSKDSGIIFTGFGYSNEKVTTQAISRPETVLAQDDGIKKISEFIRSYRESSTGSLFLLSPVLSVGGTEQKRTFSIDFSVNTSNLK